MIKGVIEVPTGHIVVTNGSAGLLEFISVGDYGKQKNLKADFLGLKDEINGVPHGDLLPLEEKWVTTISSQYGCSMGCKMCQCPMVGPGRNASLDDLLMQVRESVGLHPEVNKTKRFNLHFARMGEPTFNHKVIDATYILAEEFKSKDWGFHPVVSTMMPNWAITKLKKFLNDWMQVKNEFLNGEAGLQISVNTTCPMAREEMFSGNACSLEEISNILDVHPVNGRKITINIALTDLPVDEKALVKLFDPTRFLCKITPMHLTQACIDNNLITKDGYVSYHAYKDVEDRLKSVGFDVIVFVPSVEEDTSGITCGNAILANYAGGGRK